MTRAKARVRVQKILRQAVLAIPNHPTDLLSTIHYETALRLMEEALMRANRSSNVHTRRKAALDEGRPDPFSPTGTNRNWKDA